MEHDSSVVHQHIEPGKTCFHPLRKGRDLRWIGDVALDGAEFRIFRLHHVHHLPAATCRDELVAEFEELGREGKAVTHGASGDENGAISKIHRSTFIWHKITYITL